MNTLEEYFAQLPVAVRLRIVSARIPDFVTRYPVLLSKPMPENVSGWDICFNWTGVPFRWTPLTPMETVGLSAGAPVLLEVDADSERRERSKILALNRRGKWTPGRDLETMLQQLFGSR